MQHTIEGNQTEPFGTPVSGLPKGVNNPTEIVNNPTETVNNPTEAVNNPTQPIMLDDAPTPPPTPPKEDISSYLPPVNKAKKKAIAPPKKEKAVAPPKKDVYKENTIVNNAETPPNRGVFTFTATGEEAAYIEAILQHRVNKGQSVSKNQFIRQCVNFAINHQPNWTFARPNMAKVYLKDL